MTTVHALLCVQEIVTISPDKLPGYDEKIKMFYQEHIHSDEEIRYVLDGSGAWLMLKLSVLFFLWLAFF